jgi:hypothetical protein
MRLSILHPTLLAVMILSVQLKAQTASTTAAKTQQLDEESTRVLSSIHVQIQNMSSVARENVYNDIDAATIEKPTVPQGETLTIGKAEELLSIPAQPAAGSVLDALARTLNDLQPGPQVSVASLTPIFAKGQSIGRVLWTYKDLLDKGDPMWQLAGTGFVSSPGVVTTACHVVSLIADVSAGQAKIRAGLVVRMDFSDTVAFHKLIPVTNIVAISKATGCDIAQLALDGGADIVPLKMGPATASTKRILVVGYPLLDNYTLDDCSAEGNTVTETQFCGLRRSNPGVAKVISPGTVFTCCDNDHGGISVLTYNASTDGGQSGSPVFDADTLVVVGVHYCCTGDMPSSGLMDCDTWHPQNIKWNEAISTQSLLNEPNLKGHFSDVESATQVVAASVQRSGPQIAPLR